MFVAAVLFPLLAIAQDPPPTWTPDPNFPDYQQTDPNVNNERIACAEVAATDSFYWISTNYNMPNLRQATWQTLANLLETNQYFKTIQNNGTYSGDFYDGKKAYIQTAGYSNRLSVEAQDTPGVDPVCRRPHRQRLTGSSSRWPWDKTSRLNSVGSTHTGEWDNGHFVAITGYNAGQSVNRRPRNCGQQREPAAHRRDPRTYTFSFDDFGNATAPYTYNYPVVTYYDPYYRERYRDYLLGLRRITRTNHACPFRHWRCHPARLRMASATRRR